MNSPVVVANNLNFAFAEKPVIKELSFKVQAGEIFGLVGADGAGKSTLLQIAIGQLANFQGDIKILGKSPSDPGLREQIAYMPQGFGLYPDLSVEENLYFFADLHGLSFEKARTHIADLLQRTGLKGFESRRAGKLSGGMMQKLALACALVTEPKIMFLDEPTTGVDPLSRRAFWQLLENVRSEGVTIIYATANLEEAERCDRIGFLENGQLSRQGSPLTFTREVPATLLRISGPRARQYRDALRRVAATEMVFPVGSELRIWLKPQVDKKTFAQQLQAVNPELVSQPIVPSLADVALRSLVENRGTNAK